MKNQKGISLIKLIIIIVIIIAIIVIVKSYIIPKIQEEAEFNRKIELIEEINDSAVTYNTDVLRKNVIILTYYPDAPDYLLFKEVKMIPLDTIDENNIDTMMSIYSTEHFAVMDFNDALLEYYREILQ